MKKTSLATIMLLITLYLNAEGQIINNDFSTDQRNRLQSTAAKNAAISDATAKNATATATAASAATTHTNPMATPAAIATADRLAAVASTAAAAANTAASAAADWTGYIFGTGTLTSLENPTTPNANLSIGGVLSYKLNSITFAFNSKSATSSDSSNLTKTFLFPEITSRAFVIEYGRALFNGDGISSNFFLNFSSNYIKDTSGHLITPYNFLTGFRFSIYKDLSGETDVNVQKLKSMTFSLTPYYTMINIDPKEFNNYELIFNKSNNNNLQATINAIGGKFSFEINSLHIFFDYKYVLNSHYNSIFNNGYWTIGTAVNTKILKF